MLTHIYTPQIRHIAALKDTAAVKRLAEATAKDEAVKGVADESGDKGQQQNNQQGPSASLVEKERQGQIAITTVLKDFQKTLEAVGASQKLQQQVQAYLEVVQHQAQQSKPSVGLIRQNLTIAAQSIDSFISDSLGKPSQVVKEWVDALLSQKINYKMAASESSVLGAQQKADFDLYLNANQFARQVVPEDGITFNLQNAFANVQNLLKQQQWFAAKSVLQGILQQPDIGTKAQAKAFFTLGQLAQKEYNLPSALGYYQQVGQLLQPVLQQNNLSSTQAQFMTKAYTQLGVVAQQLEQNETAVDAFEKGLKAAQFLPDETATQKAKQLAQLLLIENQPQKTEQLLQPFVERDDLSADKTPLLQLLADAQKQQAKYKTAFQTYQKGLNLADTQEAKQPFATALAQLYLEKQQPEKALHLLQQHY